MREFKVYLTEIPEFIWDLKINFIPFVLTQQKFKDEKKIKVDEIKEIKEIQTISSCSSTPVKELKSDIEPN